MTYTGIIIAESLKDSSILEEIHILQTETEVVTEQHQTPWVKQWTMHTVEIMESDIERVAKSISISLDKVGNWYADFKNSKHHYIIFRDKVFKIDRSDISNYEEAVKFGSALGIPAYQLDFSPAIAEWQREQM